jgi:hypothetical protein
MQVLARSIIAVTIGIVFLVAMLLAFVGDLLSGERRSRQKATSRRRNRPVAAWS